MNTFRTAANVRPAALALAFAVTFAMLASVNALSRQEYREAVTAQAAAAMVAQASVDGPATSTSAPSTKA